MKQLFNKKASQRFYALVFSCLFWHFSAYAEHLVDLQIDGVKNDALKSNIQIHLNAIDKEEADGSERYQDIVSKAVDKGLRALGYYDYQIQFELKPRAKNKPLLIAHITVGEPEIGRAHV